MQIAAILNEQKGADWVTVALNAINQESMEYFGGGEHPATSSAKDLVRLYRIRLERSKLLGITQYGCAELVAQLEKLDGDAIIEVWPFANKDFVVSAFTRNEAVLVGCITQPRTL